MRERERGRERDSEGEREGERVCVGEIACVKARFGRRENVVRRKENEGGVNFEGLGGWNGKFRQ